jgi:hypothetical protein
VTLRLLFACAALAACGHTQESADDSAAFPPYPAERGLIEFFVAATSEFRFFIDPASISVGNDGVVRYTLVARSAAGAQNVSYEGMRCRSGEIRIYALGRDGGWAKSSADWRAIEARSVQRWHNALYREYFCPHKEPIASPQEGIASLRRGGHPLYEDLPRGGSGSGR